MRSAPLRRLTLAVACAAAAVALGVFMETNGSPGDSRNTSLDAGALLPDLDQETPVGLDVWATLDGTHRGYELGFTSRIRNIGDGPLVLEGNRMPAGESTRMQADQIVETDDGHDRVPAVGELTYVSSPDHSHWHYAGFDTYELRPAGSHEAVVRDRKSGFCLGDRYRVESRVVTGAAPAAVYTDECGLDRPDLTHLVEGISVGYGDNYPAHLEYQDLPLDGLPGGRYVLVHQVNADHSLREI